MSTHGISPPNDLKSVVRAALAIDGIESAAIFLAEPGSGELHLGAAAGIEGPPLDGLVAAVQNPMHPIARAMTDTDATFDVHPMNPGGPALRSHLPLGGLGVLAVAHDASLSSDAREGLSRLAAAASALVRARRG